MNEKKSFIEIIGNKIKFGFKSKAEIKGVHTLSICDATSKKAQQLSAEIGKNSMKRQFFINTLPQGTVEQRSFLAGKLRHLWLEYNYLIDQLHRFYKKREYVVENITTTVGRSVLAQRLGNDTTYSGVVNYTALGDDNTGAVVGDATLGNETSRKVLSSGTDAANISYLETFFEATEAVDIHEEYGMYIDGAAGADTGQLFNRFTQQVVKSNVETLNVQSIITFNDA